MIFVKLAVSFRMDFYLILSRNVHMISFCNYKDIDYIRCKVRSLGTKTCCLDLVLWAVVLVRSPEGEKFSVGVRDQC